MGLSLNKIPSHGLLLLAIVSIQTGAAIAVRLFQTLGPSGTAAMRVGISALLLVAVSRPRLTGEVLRCGRWIIMFGMVIAAMNVFFYQAIARIPLGNAVTIEFVGPLGLAALTSRRPLDLIWVTLAAAGVFLFSPFEGGGLDTLGLIFAGLAGVCWAGYVLLSARVGRHVEGGQGLAMAMTVAAIALLPFSIPAGGVILSKPMLLGVVLLVALMSTTIPIRLEYQALKKLSPRVYGVLISLEPAVATIVGALLLNDKISAENLLALACVTTAAMGTMLFGRPKRKG